ncbi:hypothetical protein D3C84_380390 [compost metagenome]
MSKIAEFRAAELELGKQIAALEALRNDAALKRELAFESALNNLLTQFDISRETLVGMLGVAPRADAHKATTGKRKIVNREPAKTFLNPHTGERLTVKRLSHGKYKEWVEKYGAVVVETWLQD